MLLEISTYLDLSELDNDAVKYLDDILSINDDNKISTLYLSRLWQCKQTTAKIRINALIRAGFLKRNRYRGETGSFKKTRYELTDIALSIKIAKAL